MMTSSTDGTQISLHVVLDDVKHAFGSVQHDTMQVIQSLLCFPSQLANILMLAATGVNLHMGGRNGIAVAIAKFRAGIAQGCPMSALPFCIILELRIHMGLHNITPPVSSCATFGHVAYMDDTTYLLHSVPDV